MASLFAVDISLPLVQSAWFPCEDVMFDEASLEREEAKLAEMEVAVVNTEPMGFMKNSRPDNSEPKSDDDEDDDNDSDTFAHASDITDEEEEESIAGRSLNDDDSSIGLEAEETDRSHSTPVSGDISTASAMAINSLFDTELEGSNQSFDLDGSVEEVAQDTVNQLMQLGFDEEASRNALIMAGGDVQTAANALLS